MPNDFSSMLRRAAYGFKGPTLVTAVWEAIGGHPSSWFTISITDDPANRRIAHGNPAHWWHWLTASENDARGVESYFRSFTPPMQGGVGGETKGTFLYVFLEPSPCRRS